MHRTVIVTILLLLAIPAWAKLYKCTDAAGNIIYTDEPCIGGEELKLPPLPTFSSQKKPAPSATSNDEEPKLPPGEKPAFEGYTSLKIVQPQKDRVVQSTSGKVDISVAISPPLQVDAGHKIQISFDGQALKTTGSTTRVQLNNVDRGTHTVQVSVLDSKGAVVKSSSTVRFHVRVTSVIGVPNPLKAPQSPSAQPAPRAPTPQLGPQN